MPIPPAADVAFRLAANAAAQAFAQAPPYIAYRADATVDVPALRRHQVISRQVEARTKDDFAALQDLPRGQHQYAHSFPLIPTFDALSYFRLEYNGNMHDALSYVKQIQPITFTDPRLTSHADVVVTSLRYYRASYAADSQDGLLHIVMDPLPSLTRGNDSDFYIHDLYVNPATNLPVRVTYAGPEADFTCDYTTVAGQWVVSHVFYRRTMFAPLRLGRIHFTVDANFTDVTFPAVPSDPKVAAAPPAA